MDKMKLNKGHEHSMRVLVPLQQIEALYRGVDICENHLTSAIGVPICMEHCGRCCEVTTPDVWEIEAQFLISALVGSGGLTVPNLIATCENWLTERNPRFTTYGMASKQLSPQEWLELRPQMNHLLESSPCPFLDGEKRCLVHFARPLACRCYGVTRIATQLCPRPLAKIESVNSRANIAPESEPGKMLRKMLMEALKSAESVGWGWTYFLPTILYKNLEPKKFAGLVDSGRIPTVKLLKLRTNTSILFQDQLSEIWAKEAAR